MFIEKRVDAIKKWSDAATSAQSGDEAVGGGRGALVPGADRRSL
jgi:hypothetical protein